MTDRKSYHHQYYLDHKKYGRKNTTKWNIDHCHQTKRVRGLLCNNCNSLLGYAGDNISFTKSY